MQRLRSLLLSLRESLWFIPSLTIGGGIVVAVLVIETETGFVAWAGDHWPRYFGATPDGARWVLGTIATAMATVAGVVYSMTLVTLSLASSHYGSRVLRRFMRDPSSQLALGTFLGVFAYCLVVARTVRSGDDPFVPTLGVTIALASAILAIGMLVHFVHHVARSVQAPEILAALAQQTLKTIEKVSATDASGDEADLDDRDAPGRWRPIEARTSGFVQGVDGNALFSLACARDLVVRVEAATGDFVVAGTPLVRVLGAAADAQLEEAVNGCFGIGPDRSIDGDVGYGVRQIVDIALRALSPGTNDPTTAVLSIHWLNVILCRLADTRFPPAVRLDEGRTRLIDRRPAFDAVLRTAFEQIARAARGDPLVLNQLAESLEAIAAAATDAQRRSATADLAALLHGVVSRDVDDPQARKRLQQRLRHMATAPATPPPADDDDRAPEVDAA